MAIECKHRVKPFPKEWCSGCIFNGCYNWNRNPFLLCSLMGGLIPVIELSSEKEDLCCASAQQVTEDFWLSHLSDLKREAETNEECRLRAMHGKVYSNQILPAESVAMKRRRK